MNWLTSSVYIALLLLLNTVKWKVTSEQKSYNFSPIVHFCQHEPPPFPWSFSKKLLGSQSLCPLNHPIWNMKAILEIAGEQCKASRNVLIGTSCLSSVISFLGVQWIGWMDMYIILEQQKYIEKRKYSYKSWRISPGEREQQKMCPYDH